EVDDVVSIEFDRAPHVQIMSPNANWARLAEDRFSAEIARRFPVPPPTPTDWWDRHPLVAASSISVAAALLVGAILTRFQVVPGLISTVVALVLAAVFSAVRERQVGLQVL